MEDATARNGTRVADVVRLEVPGTLEYVRVVRLTAAAVAARLAFDVEEIEDVRVAVDELVSTVIEAGGGAEVRITFSSLDESFVVEGDAQVVREPAIDDLTRQILSVVVDTFEVTTSDDVARFRATKRSTSGG
jgi:hypothetical protein